MSMVFKKYAKTVVITIPSANSLLKLLFFMEIVLYYDFSTLINKF